jgi:hypothetical protein
MLVREIREVLSGAGFNLSLYSVLQIGAAIMEVAAGIGDAFIKSLGWWHSSAYSVYIKMPTSSLSVLTSQIAD